jgi:hypothetical protein
MRDQGHLCGVFGQPIGQHHRHRTHRRDRTPSWRAADRGQHRAVSPYLSRPIEHGADIVVHSLTKYLGGHGTTLGGAIVDSGKFPWAEHKERFKRLNEPDVSYHGVVYTEALGAAAYIGRARVVPLRNTGAALSPFNAFLILQGIETLSLRMDRISENTLKIAQYLQKHPRGQLGQLCGLGRPSREPSGQEVPLGPSLWFVDIWCAWWSRGRRTLPGWLEPVHALGQHWGCALLGDTPSVNHTPPTVA